MLRKSLHSSPFLHSCQNPGKFAFFPIPPFLPKSRGIKDPISTSITLCWYFLFFSFSCSTKINSVDLFWLHVEFTCVKHTSKNAVSPRDQKLPPLCPVQPQDGLVMVHLRLNTSLSIGRRWGSTSTSLQILLSRDVRRFWMPLSLCTKTRLLTRKSVADCESISTRAMARQVR